MEIEMGNNTSQRNTDLFYYLLSKSSAKKTIEKQPRNEGGNLFPLSFSQEEFYFLYQLQPDDLALNVSFAYQLSGQLNISALEKTFSEVIKRHEIMRTVFINQGAFQSILPFTHFHLPMIDIEAENVENPVAYAQEILSDISRKPYDLAQGPLFRVQLIKLAEENYILWWGMHHIICDAWGQMTLMKEIKALYAWYAFDKKHELPELFLQMADFAVWQRKNYETGGLKEKTLTWVTKLSGYEKNVTLPIDFERPAKQTYHGMSENIHIGEEIRRKLKELSVLNNTTLFTIILSALKMLIYKFTNQVDIVIGSPFSIRNFDFLENLICDLSNMLLYRTVFDENDSIDSAIGKVKEATLETIKYNDVPSQHIYYSLNHKHDPAYSPLFQVMLVFHQIFTRDNDQFIEGMTSKYVHIANKSSQFDLSLFLFDDDEIGLYGKFDYNTALYTRETICEFIKCFTIILKIIAEKPELKIVDLSKTIERERIYMYA